MEGDKRFCNIPQIKKHKCHITTLFHGLQKFEALLVLILLHHLFAPSFAAVSWQLLPSTVYLDEPTPYHDIGVLGGNSL